MADDQTFRSRAASAAHKLLADTVKTAWDLFKVMVPILVATKILQEIGVIHYLGIALSPLMRLVGLPGSMGLAWATALVTNIYGGMAVFAALAPAENLTVAQATIVCTMILVAHALPVELRIAQKAGPRLRAMAVLRVVSAIVLAFILHQVYSRGGWLQAPNEMLWNAPPADPTWLQWSVGQARSLGMIFLIILALLFLLRMLEWLGVMALVTRILEPVLELLGMSKDAAPITIIGMTLGLSLGGGLIIQEAKSGKLSGRDVFFSLSLMGLCHSLIEDTVVMSALGAHASGTLLARMIFSVLVVFLLVRLISLVPGEALRRHFFRASPGDLPREQGRESKGHDFRPSVKHPAKPDTLYKD